MKVLDRILGYTDEMMTDRCDILISVVSQTKIVKDIEVMKYKDSEGVLDMLKKSREFYSGQKNTGFMLRDYQVEIIDRACEIINRNGFVYLAMQVRTGKTLTSLGIAQKLGSKNVLFVTKKKAMSSIQEDFGRLEAEYMLRVINYESLHTVMNEAKWDMLILDEAHSCFLGSTLIDGVKIKDIKLGDCLNSFNFDKNKYEKRKVLNVFKNKLSENLVKIKCNGKEIVCTESHKIYTKRGWVKAKDITTEDELQVV